MSKVYIHLTHSYQEWLKPWIRYVLPEWSIIYPFKTFISRMVKTDRLVCSTISEENNFLDNITNK